MSGLTNTGNLYLEIGPNRLKALHGEEGLELMIEREPAGRLTAACKEKLVASLTSFLKRRSWQPRSRAFCAIGARGVSLRRLTLPAAGKDEFQRLLRMQIESEFPLAPDELAWGYQVIAETRQNGASKQDLLLMAVRREVIQDYAAVLSQCGVTPLFTLAAVARCGLISHPPQNYGMFESEDAGAELIVYEGGTPTVLRVLAADTVAAIAGAIKAANGHSTTLFCSGPEAAMGGMAASVMQELGPGVECQPLRLTSGAGRSAAVLGLKKIVEDHSAPPLLFQLAQDNGREPADPEAPKKWAVLAGVLLLGLLLLPYVEAILLKPWLARKFNAMKSATGQLAVIDRDLEFLQFLKQNQPPYLDALYLFAKSAPSGSKIDSLTMNRRGDVSLRGSMRTADQVAEFRSKLIASGFFSTVAVEEQAPTPDRQKVNVRMTAQWKPFNELQVLAIGPTADEIEKAKNKKEPTPVGMPAGFPGGMPPGTMPSVTPSGAMPAGARAGVALVAGAPGATSSAPTNAPVVVPARKEGQ